MRFSSSAVATVLAGASTMLLCAPVNSFAPSRTAFVAKQTVVVSHQAGCPCAACTGIHAFGCTCAACTGIHSFGCTCPSCVRSGATRLYADADTAATEVPAEIEAMDGINSEDEAHNAERPARESLKKKRPPSKGKPLSEFSAGDSVKATVKTITNYGAFCDFGAQTDGLVHISRVATGFVKDVNEILSAGQEVEARIVEIDADKNQVALTLLTKEQEAEAEAPRQPRQQRGGGRRDDSAATNALQEKGWDSEAFVEGEVVSTVPFGAFVRVPASSLNSEVEGEFDGLVHISALTAGRASSVEQYAKVGDKVQVRCKSIGDGKVSLSMVSVEDEKAAQAQQKAFIAETRGAADWKEQLEAKLADQPKFVNGPVVVDLRK